MLCTIHRGTVLALLVAAVAALRPASSLRSIRPLRTLQGSRLAGATLSSTESYDDIVEAADFFVGAFWLHSTSHECPSLPEHILTQLRNAQRKDMEARYGELLGDRRLKSSLILSKGEDGFITGCVALELALVSGDQKTFYTRRESEAMLDDAKKGLGGRAKNELRKMPFKDTVGRLLGEEYRVAPVLSNLAVGAEARGQGVARRLCSRCEDLGCEWGYDEVLLLVEDENARAKGLYASLGYEELWTDEDATALRINVDAEPDAVTQEVKLMKEVNARHVAMRKALP